MSRKFIFKKSFFIANKFVDVFYLYELFQKYLLLELFFDQNLRISDIFLQQDTIHYSQDVG